MFLAVLQSYIAFLKHAGGRWESGLNRMHKIIDFASFCMYDLIREITYDPVKNCANIAERGLSFNSAAQFDFSTALVYADTRKNYGETRYIGVGHIGTRLHVVVFTETDSGVRVISLRRMSGRSKPMKHANKPMIDKDSEVRELTAADLKQFRPVDKTLPGSLQAKLGVRRRGPQKSPTKERITIRLSSSVVEGFRSTGPGWQARIDSALQDWLKSHRP